MSDSRDSAPATRRKWRTKSRRGCQSCKARKVKCDEQHPSCLNCIKRGIRCDFLQPQGQMTPSITSATLELELLHHFTISTCATLTTEPQVRELWRVLVPQIGFSTRYILDGVLGLAALHMGRYNPARRDQLLSQATHYHAASLEQALPLIPGIAPQNGSNLFLFGVLTLFFCLARPKREEDMLVIGNNGVIPEWLYLLRGMDALIDEAESAIRNSPVSLIYRTTDESLDFWKAHSPEDNEALNQLEVGIRSLTSREERKQAVLQEAMDALKRSYTFSSTRFSEHDKLRGFYTWLFKISDEYLELLKNADNEALCVLAYFSVLLKQLERYWWLEGWGVHLIRRIYMLLNDEYRLWIRWPIEEIGWVPESY
ncbi:putative C6 transcription factor [Mariannaea sp. PMI_226]|nr:putative C6 transcription factor [Mariannaea sp. PMI_226]